MEIATKNETEIDKQTDQLIVARLKWMPLALNNSKLIRASK